MKLGNYSAPYGVRAACVIILASLAVLPAFADDHTVELTSIVIDTLNGAYTIDGVEYHYTWKAEASKWKSKTADQSFPVIAPVQTGPVALIRQKPDQKSIGIQGSFDRHGYNWIDIYPSAVDGDGAPAEIPLRGRTRFIDVWAWGSNLNYHLEAYLRDNRGVIHTLPVGSLKFVGWRNLRATVPTSIPMVATIIPRSTHAVTFVKFRLWSRCAGIGAYVTTKYHHQHETKMHKVCILKVCSQIEVHISTLLQVKLGCEMELLVIFWICCHCFFCSHFILHAAFLVKF